MKALSASMKPLRLGDTLVRRNPFVYPAARTLFDRLESADLEERARWTERRLAAFLAVAARTPYGRRVGGDACLESWPILEKERVRERPMDFLARPAWTASPSATSGTTGTPLRIWRSLPSLAIEQAAIDRLLARAGADPARARSAVLRGDDIKAPADREPPFWKPAGGGRRLVFSSNHLNAETLPHFVRAIEAHRPEVLHAYPSVLESFCRLLRAAGTRLHVPITICSSETLPAGSWGPVAETLATRLIDYYGLAERVAFAYAFEPARYTFLPGYALHELRPAGDEGDFIVYELIGTGLWNATMPLPRFRTGDLVRLPKTADPARVAAGCESFPGVSGRAGDYLIGPDGAILLGIDHIPRGVEHVVRMQVVQESATRVRLLTLPAEGFGDADRETILRHAAMKLPPPMRAEIEIVDQLRRTAAGKTPFVIRESFERRP